MSGSEGDEADHGVLALGEQAPVLAEEPVTTGEMAFVHLAGQGEMRPQRAVADGVVEREPAQRRGDEQRVGREPFTRGEHVQLGTGVQHPGPPSPTGRSRARTSPSPDHASSTHMTESPRTTPRPHRSR
nr:hypothetical protein [Streptomyces sp. UNOC14_S4]